MIKYKIDFTDIREDSETYLEVIATYIESGTIDGEAIAKASITFHSDHPEFDPNSNEVQTGCQTAQEKK